MPCALSVCLFQLLMIALMLSDVKRDLITATAVIAGLSSFMFGFFTNLPVALA
jgi:xanthine/uracil/vitamin C permease (AzgA family)